MTLALATRGYLCIPGSIPVPVKMLDPPTIVRSGAVEAQIVGQSSAGETAPVIKGGKSLTPVIRGATASSPVTPPASPSVVGGKSLVPIIRSAKED